MYGLNCMSKLFNRKKKAFKLFALQDVSKILDDIQECSALLLFICQNLSETILPRKLASRHFPIILHHKLFGI